MNKEDKKALAYIASDFIQYAKSKESTHKEQVKCILYVKAILEVIEQ